MDTDDPEKQLIAACKYGDTKAVRELVEGGRLDPGAVIDRDHYNWTPLHHACYAGHQDVVTFLVTTGHADVNSKDKYGYTPLYRACIYNRVEVVQWLLENSTISDIETVNYVLRWASGKGHLKIVTNLVTSTNADVNSKDNRGQTALHKACKRNRVEVVQWLTKNAKIGDIETANYVLRWASEHDHSEIVQWIIYESDAKISDDESINSVLDWSSMKNQLEEMVQFLTTNAKFSVDTTNCVLRWACGEGHIEIVTNLVTSTNADVNSKDEYGQTALHKACANGELEVVKYLVNNSNANINATDNGDNTPLDRARQCGWNQVAEFLVEHDAKHSELKKSDICLNCQRKFAFYRRQYKCRSCLASVCDNCSKHKLPISNPSSKPERVCDICFDVLSAQCKNESRPLSADEMRILNMVLVEYLDELKDAGLCFETVVDNQPTTDQPATDQPIITKKRVMECLQQIGQHELAAILSKKQGIKELQDHVYKNVYENALRSEKAEVRLQVFKMILSGVPRSGKTTFWKRIATKDFQPSETSTSTGVAESHFLSAHMSTEMLLDLHLYSETDTSDLTTEALTIYKHILLCNKEAASTQTDSSQSESVVSSESSSNVVKQEFTSVPSKSASIENIQVSNDQTPYDEHDSDQYEKHTTLPAAIRQSETTHPISISESEYLPEARKQVVKYAFRELIDENLLAAQKQEIEQICQEIDLYFDELINLLKKGEKLPIIPTIKKICHLIDTGGQRAFLELLPTVTVGKALYLLFFSYEHFGKQLRETVQQQGASIEVHTGTFYEQMDIVMQSLICVSTTSSRSRDNVALLVGTHVDKVEFQHVEYVNNIVSKKVEPFLKSGLVFAEEDKMVLEVCIKETERCSNRPKDYRKVIMDTVQSKLSCPESEKLPPSWYMFSIVLRRMKIAGYSVLQYSHCQQIAKKLYIKEMQLQSLLSRLHKILGIVMYFPEVHELKDIVICDPSVVYRGISELIFNSFSTKSCPVLSLRLKKWGIFMYRELKEHCSNVKTANKGCQIQIEVLIIILQHLGIIAPVQFSESSDPSISEPKNEDCLVYNIDSEFVIPSVLADALPEELKLQLREGEACSIIPLRIYFKCGFSPMGGFCYLFTRLISDQNWKLPVEKEQMMTENRTYWRNKATLIVQVDEKKYLVTLTSTKVYFEIHIVHTHSKEPFQLGRDGRSVCRKIWNDVESVLSNSLNAPLKEYTLACPCRLHPKAECPEHVMEFDSIPHDNQPQVTARCLLHKERPHPLTVDPAKQSIIVWFKKPHDHQTKDLGDFVEISMDHLFMVTSSREQLVYEWSFNDRKIAISDKHFKNSDTNTLKIDCFECKYVGTYKCIVSTASQPTVSMSAKVKLYIREPPNHFDSEMDESDFLLYLNANDIPYKVCKMLQENEITAKRFNLSSFEYWSGDLNLTALEKKDLQALLVAGDYLKCPVCRNIQVDPCTLQCGHTVCQLCVANMWKNNTKSCPICKETWRDFPAISYDYRANIEGSYGSQVDQLRKEYTQEEKELIEKYLEAKKSCSLTPEYHDLKMDSSLAEKYVLKEESEKGLDDIRLSPWIFPKDMNNDQLAVWLYNCPGLMGADYHHDIGKLKEAKINGKQFLSLSEDSMKQFGLSADFQILLTKTIEDLKEYQHPLGTKILLPPHQQKSLKRTAATSTADVQQQSYSPTAAQQAQLVETKSDESSSIESTCIHSTEKSKSQLEETDVAQSISAQATDLGVWKLPGVEECAEKSVVVHSSQGQLVEWSGLKLHIHKGSLPKNLHQCTIYIKASLAGDYKIPANSSLVSAVIWLRCEPQCTFTKPITVEIQHCSTKQDLSKLKIVRAFCNQKQLPYKFKPLGGRFDTATSYGAVEVNSFSGVGIIEENPVSDRMYYSQLFYRSYHSHQQRHEIHITFTWNTDTHINYVTKKYPEDGFYAGCYQVIELDGTAIKVDLDKAKWTKVMDGQWEIQPAKPTVTKAELDVFKMGRGIPNCVLEARPLCENFPQLLHEIILSGIKPPHHELILSYMPSRKDPTGTGGGVQQPQASATVQPQLDVCPQVLTFSTDMSYEQLAVWLTNHSQLVGVGYQQDISKLKDARINGYAFLTLNESKLERFGVTYGFQTTLVNIVENLKRSQLRQDSQTLQLQQQSPTGSTAPPTTELQQDQQTSSATDNLDKLPTLKELMMLKYREKGEEKKIRIIKDASHKWKDIASLICDDPNKVSKLEEKLRGDHDHCLRQTLVDDFINKKPADYSHNWSGLIELLDSVDLEELAGRIKCALL